MNTFKELIEFVRTKNIGDVITRKEIRAKLVFQQQYNSNTVDTYINFLDKCEIFCGISPGKYKLIAKPKQDLKSTELRKVYDSKRRWFHIPALRE